MEEFVIWTSASFLMVMLAFAFVYYTYKTIKNE